MPDSEHWAALRAYLAPPPAPDPADPPDPPDPPDPAQPADPTDPTPKRRFHPSRIGPALDSVLPTGLVQAAARVPTPGGLFPLVAALVFFLFAIVPAGPGGTSRLQLMWMAITGGAQLTGTDAAASVDQANATAAISNLLTSQGLPVLPNATSAAVQAALAEQQGQNPLLANLGAVGSELLPWHFLPDAFAAIKQL